MVLALIVVGCGSTPSTAGDAVDTSAKPETTSSSPATSPSATTAPSSSAGTTSAAPSTTTLQAETLQAEEDLVVFIATLEEMLAGTSYEGEALNEPDVFVATGRLFCERLNEGDSADDVLSAYLDQLAGGVDLATDDELVLAGALLGTAVGALCPEHAALIG